MLKPSKIHIILHILKVFYISYSIFNALAAASNPTCIGEKNICFWPTSLILTSKNHIFICASMSLVFYVHSRFVSFSCILFFIKYDIIIMSYIILMSYIMLISYIIIMLYLIMYDIIIMSYLIKSNTTIWQNAATVQYYWPLPRLKAYEFVKRK